MVTRERLFNAGGYVGIILIQGATLPSLIGVAMGWSHELPPLSMTLMVWAGLFLFFCRSVHAKQTLYIISEGAGLLLQSIVLAFICLPRH